MNTLELAKYIDHSILHTDLTSSELRDFCQEAIPMGVFSVAINSYWVKEALEYLKGTDILVDSSIGFPLGQTSKNLSKLAARKKKAADKKLSAAAGAILAKYRVGKYFYWDVKEERFSFSLDQEKIKMVESLDGCYVIRTDVDKKHLSKEKAVKGYKRLAGVEKAFRNLKTVSLEIRPIYHYLDERISAHVFLCMLAYYVQWHMQERLKAPL